MIGKYFSNGWKIFADFSNDWKNFSRVFQRLEKFFYGNEDSFKGSVPLISLIQPRFEACSCIVVHINENSKRKCRGLHSRENAPHWIPWKIDHCQIWIHGNCNGRKIVCVNSFRLIHTHNYVNDFIAICTVNSWSIGDDFIWLAIYSHDVCYVSPLQIVDSPQLAHFEIRLKVFMQ